MRAAILPRRAHPVTDAVAAADLRVGGLVPFTTTDFPGKLAAVVFCQGCPWRCRYCHNPHLLPPRGVRPELEWAGVLEWLDTRRGLLDAVVFSGGEATAQEAVVAAMEAVRARGFAVGLHTAGIYPRRLERLLRLVDWIGLDIKAPAADYAPVTGVALSGAPAFASLELLLRHPVPFEVRTTVHAKLTPAALLRALAAELAARGVQRWMLQPFRATGCRDEALNTSASLDAGLTPALVAELSRVMPDIVVR